MEKIKGDLRNRPHFDRPTALTVGNFDGLHRGHQFLIEKLMSVAADRSLSSAVLSFYPHPNQVLGGKAVDLLFSQEDKVLEVEKLGVDCFAVQDFSLDFAKFSAEDFLRQYLFKIFKPQYLLLGYDFNFGKGGVGGFDLAQSIGKEYGCVVERVEPFKMNGEIVSSTSIRKALASGLVEDASAMLGRPYYIRGEVVRGHGLGRQWGIPTANLSEIKTLLPKTGVYAGVAVYNGKSYKAVLNVGMRPTIHADGSPAVECHILDFDKDIYGQELRFAFYNKIRDEQKFPDKMELIKQIQKDIESVKNMDLEEFTH